MKRFKMRCGCYVCDHGFRVGYKYLTAYVIRQSGVRATTAKVFLTDGILQRLQEIKDDTAPTDWLRTSRVLEVAHNPDEYY